MRLQLRFSLLTVLIGALLAVAVPAAAQAAVGIEKFVAVNCSEGHETCGQELIGGVFSYPKEPNTAEAEEQGELQAGARVPFGVTAFSVTTTGKLPAAIPTGVVSHIRTDVAPGLATAPTAVAQCSAAEFGAEALPGSGFFGAPACKSETKIGVNKVTVFAGPAGDVPIEGEVYNLEQPQGLASEFGVALKLPKPLTEAKLFEVFKGTKPEIEEAQYFAHTLIEGSVEWGAEAKGTGQADYHDYFNIEVSTALPLVSSRLVFFGRSGRGDFITNATSCPGNNTTRLTLEGEGAMAVRNYTTPIGLRNCAALPFAPSFALSPETTGSDRPDGISTEVAIPHDPTKVDSSQLKSATIVLPPGMTLNPSAAAGLTACTPAQAMLRVKTTNVNESCPASSRVGSATLEVPTLPPGSLSGNMYLGSPDETAKITNTKSFPMYLVVNSERYGVSVRVKGNVSVNQSNGQVSATFSENPEQPFSNVVLHFNGGGLAPIVNPLKCGTATTNASFTPFSGTASQSTTSAFTVNNGSGGACANPLPFGPGQTTANQPPANGGANTSFAIRYTRPEGDQFLNTIKTTLPAGLVGKIPAVTLCGEPQASKGECPAASQIGIVRAEAGSGVPFTFVGGVFLTGPYNGAPYGLTIVVPANAGPFALGNVVSRGAITIDQTTARVTATSTLPRIFAGVPLRLRAVQIEINKQGFLVNPTNCATLATESTLSGFSPGGGTSSSVSLSTPFQVNNCSALAFKPTFTASSTGKTSKANGASLVTKITQPAGQANFKSVVVQLPKQLPSRLTTLQKACLEKTFANNPKECPVDSKVGGATVTTPTLPTKLTGSAYIVSHGGAAFPDLDLVLEGSGVKIIMTGNTAIKKGITTTTFASTPDVPVSSVELNLPVGAHSALAANGNLCASKLVMPTTMTAQNGKTLKQNTAISVTNCGVRIVGHKTVGNTAYLTVHTYAPGRISGKGKNVATVFRKLSKAQKAATLKVSLSKAGRRHRRPLKVKIRVGFIASKKGAAPTSASFVTVTYR